jgi:DNA primase
VREETGRYKCFGCDKGGDVFTFVQEIEHTDFVGAVEYLAEQGGHPAHRHRPASRRSGRAASKLVEAMARAVDWYHERLLTSTRCPRARDYLRSRGLAGDVARQFKIGWAPDDWDALARESGISPTCCATTVSRSRTGATGCRTRSGRG